MCLSRLFLETPLTWVLVLIPTYVITDMSTLSSSYIATNSEEEKPRTVLILRWRQTVSCMLLSQ